MDVELAGLYPRISNLVVFRFFQENLANFSLLALGYHRCQTDNTLQYACSNGY